MLSINSIKGIIVVCLLIHPSVTFSEPISKITTNDIPSSIQGVCLSKNKHLAEQRCFKSNRKAAYWLKKHLNQKVSLHCEVGVRKRGQGFDDAPIGCVDNHRSQVKIPFNTKTLSLNMEKSLRERCQRSRWCFGKDMANLMSHNFTSWKRECERREHQAKNKCAALVNGVFEKYYPGHPPHKNAHIRLKNVEIKFQ